MIKNSKFIRKLKTQIAIKKHIEIINTQTLVA